MQPLRLEVVIASTRPGRIGWPVGTWFLERARAHGGFDVSLIDLKELALPMLDEPKHPRLGQYEHEHTKRWSASVAAADAFVFVTPEYNHGMSGVLKNTIDWLSRPPNASVLNRKAAAVLGASPGMTGTARAQEQVRQTLCATNTCVMAQPEVLVARAHEKFDADGRLTDEATRVWVGKLLEALRDWATRLAR